MEAPETSGDRLCSSFLKKLLLYPLKAWVDKGLPFSSYYFNNLTISLYGNSNNSSKQLEFLFLF